MRPKTILWSLAAVGAGMLVYGAAVEARRLTLRRFTLRLHGWPSRLAGFRLAVLGDFHITDEASMELAHEAVLLALDSAPDMIAIPGDFVGYWKPSSPRMLGTALEPLLLMEGSVVAVPGNHDYYGGDPALLAAICHELNIKLLRNESWRHGGVQWVGVDSANAGEADPIGAFAHADPDEPTVVLWHEPDLAEWIPGGASLALSGHSHGGQFRFPGGWAPMKTRNGRRFVRGWYPKAPTPLFVTSGVGTTGPPSRFLCPPEVALLTLEPA